jgi:hypothetical protein
MVMRVGEFLRHGNGECHIARRIHATLVASEQRIAEMTEHCCQDMRNFTRTRQEFEESEAGKFLIEQGHDFSDYPEPVVRFEPRFGYAVGYVAISYCPWCGSKLPQIPIEKLMAEGIVVSVDQDGTTSWAWKGEKFRDWDELLARVKKDSSE